MKRFFTLILTLAFAATLSSGARAEDTLDKAKRKGALIAGVKDDSPPFGFMEKGSGKIIGYDVDYVAAIAKKLGVSPQFRSVGQSKRLAELIDGNVDLIAANLTRSAALDLAIDFSDPYLVTGQGFLAKKGAVKGMRDLFGKKIGAVLGTPSETCARNACEGGTIVPFGDYTQALQALQKGEIIAFSSDEAILVDLLAGMPSGEYEIPDLLISKQEFVFGVRQGDKNFLDFLNKTIAEMNQSGETKRIKNTWFTPREDRPPAAYGAMIRKAAATPRVLALSLDGTFYPNAEISIFTINGDPLGRGTIVSVTADQFYVDVEPSIYNLVMPGSLITLNIGNDMAKNIAIRQQPVLQSVKADSEKEAARIQAEQEKEGIEKEKRNQELDMERERNIMEINRERSRYFYWRRW